MQKSLYSLTVQGDVWDCAGLAHQRMFRYRYVYKGMNDKVHSCPDVAAILQFNRSTNVVSIFERRSRKKFRWSSVQVLNHWPNIRSWHANTVCSLSLTPKLLIESTIVISLLGTALYTKSVMNSSRSRQVQFANQCMTVDICVCTHSSVILTAKQNSLLYTNFSLHAQKGESTGMEAISQSPSLQVKSYSTLCIYIS